MKRRFEDIGEKVITSLQQYTYIHNLSSMCVNNLSQFCNRFLLRVAKMIFLDWCMYFFFVFLVYFCKIDEVNYKLPENCNLLRIKFSINFITEVEYRQNKRLKVSTSFSQLSTNIFHHQFFPTLEKWKDKTWINRKKWNWEKKKNHFVHLVSDIFRNVVQAYTKKWMKATLEGG